MESAEKQFGPLHVDDDPNDPFARVALWQPYAMASENFYRDDMPQGPIDEMIKALRDAANWLEWRQACERRNKE